MCYNDCVMDYQAFRKKLDSLNKVSLAALIAGTGLKRRDEQILKWWYVDEKDINQIAAYHIRRRCHFQKVYINYRVCALP